MELKWENCFGYSKSESFCKQKIVFTPILRSLSTSSGVWQLAVGKKQKSYGTWKMVELIHIIKLGNKDHL